MLRPPKDTIGNLKISCVCKNCPSYGECVRNAKQNFFCFEGKANCTLERYGCICMQCPVYSTKKLSGGYFCMAGKAKTK